MILNMERIRMRMDEVYSTQMSCLHGVDSVRAVCVGRAVMRRWKTRVEMRKEPKKRIWMPRPPRMMFSPVRVSSFDSAVARSPPPARA